MEHTHYPTCTHCWIITHIKNDNHINKVISETATHVTIAILWKCKLIKFYTNPLAAAYAEFQDNHHRDHLHRASRSASRQKTLLRNFLEVYLRKTRGLAIRYKDHHTQISTYRIYGIKKDCTTRNYPTHKPDFFTESQNPTPLEESQPAPSRLPNYIVPVIQSPTSITYTPPSSHTSGLHLSCQSQDISIVTPAISHYSSPFTYHMQSQPPIPQSPPSNPYYTIFTPLHDNNMPHPQTSTTQHGLQIYTTASIQQHLPADSTPRQVQCQDNSDIGKEKSSLPHIHLVYTFKHFLKNKK